MSAILKTTTQSDVTMEEVASYVVVFPAIFAKKRIPQLVSNIKTVLKTRGQQYRSVRRDCDVILVHANDPVFASSAIGLLFGVSRVAIARRIDNNYDEVVSKIASIGGNLLLRGDRFLVRVDGDTKGYTAKDAEIAATSKIIEKKEHGAIPGTEEKFDKELYTHVTQKNAYVCIFSDGAMWGAPTDKRSGAKHVICAIYDELSAVSCFECMRQGHAVKMIIFYKRRAELLNLARLLNRLIPRMLSEEVELEFVRTKGGGKSGKTYSAYVTSITDSILDRDDTSDGGRIALAASYGMFPARVTDMLLTRVFARGAIPIMPLAGSGIAIYEIARELSLSKSGIKQLEKTINAAATSKTDMIKDSDKIRTEDPQKITVKVGANNMHDILDSLYPLSAAS